MHNLFVLMDRREFKWWLRIRWNFGNNKLFANSFSIVLQDALPVGLGTVIVTLHV